MFLEFLWAILVLLPLRVLNQVYAATTDTGSRFRKYRHDWLRLGLLELAGQGLRIDPKYHWLINLRPRTLLYLIERSHPEVVSELPNYGKWYDSQLYWLAEKKNRRSEDPVVIYLHGGAYTHQATPQHLEALVLIYALVLPETRKQLSILCLNYKLAGDGYPMPIQLKQLTTTYENLVREGSDNFILFGDSAGGNLAITFLQLFKENQHLRPLPYPKGILMVSPWVKLYPDIDDYKPGYSYYDNQSRDYILWLVLKLRYRLKNLIGDQDVASLTLSPGNCKPNLDDWNIPTLEHAFVVLGEDELMRDDMVRWCQYALGIPIELSVFDEDSKAQPVDRYEYVINQGKLQVHIEPWGVHDSILLEGMGILSELDDGKHPEELSSKKYFTLPKIAKYLDFLIEKDHSAAEKSSQS